MLLFALIVALVLPAGSNLQSAWIGVATGIGVIQIGGVIGNFRRSRKQKKI